MAISRQQRRREARADKKRVGAKKGPEQAEDLAATPSHSSEKKVDPEKKVERPPADVQTKFEEALALHQAGNIKEAAALYRALLKEVPGHPGSNHLLGVAEMQSGNLLEARELIERAISLEPNVPQFYCNLGIALYQMGEFSQAEAAYFKARELNPELIDAWCGQGDVCLAAGRLEESLAAFERACDLSPDHFVAHDKMAYLFHLLGRNLEAEATYRRTLEIKPDSAIAMNNLGSILALERRYEEAAVFLRQALSLDPEYPEAWNNLGNILKDQNRIDEAVSAFRKAIEIKPDFSDAHSNLLFVMELNPIFSLEDIVCEQKNYDLVHARSLSGLIKPFVNEPDSERRLRIGYVSADFYEHSATQIFAPMLFDYDRENFDVVCYSNGFKQDALTERFKQSATLWRDIKMLSDDEAADMIRADGIDILIDLSGHTAGNRLLVFARKSAPVQVNTWGQGVGTGLEAMDYLFTDEVQVPLNEAGIYAESIYHLPSSLVYMPTQEMPDITPPPVLSRGYVTFGSLNRFSKTTKEVMKLWARLVREIPNAHLLLKSPDLDEEGVREVTLNFLVEAGLPAERIDLLGASGKQEHIRTYNEIDIALDPFPQNGGVTTFEALWMGVPVITLLGTTNSGRASASILKAAGCPEFIADTQDNYMRLAVGMGNDLQRLSGLRETPRIKIQSAPVGNRALYVSAVEKAYRDIWKKWCKEQGEVGA